MAAFIISWVKEGTAFSPGCCFVSFKYVCPDAREQIRVFLITGAVQEFNAQCAAEPAASDSSLCRSQNIVSLRSHVCFFILHL